MKKRERSRKDGNVVFFPNLEKRLFEKGLSYIEKKRFREAIPFFEEAKELDPDNSDIWFALVLAYYESGVYEKAKEYTEEMLRVGIGEYFQTIDMFIMILVQLKEYKQVVHTIEVLLDEHEIPLEKYEHFKRLLEFSRRMVDGAGELDIEFEDEGDLDNNHVALDSLNLFHPKDEKQLPIQVANLAHQNIQPVLHEILEYLQSNEGQPFIKTMLLHVLKEHQYKETVIVTKQNAEMEIVPAELEDLREHPQKVEMSKLLSRTLEQDNPTLFEQAISLIDRHLFILYPFRYPTEDIAALAGAYHLFVLMLFGQNYSTEKMSHIYEASVEKIDSLLTYIQEIEEFSYPII